MPVFLSGQGTIQVGTELLYKGEYTINTSGPPTPPIILRGPGGASLLTGSSEPVELSGTFEVCPISVTQLMNDYKSGNLSRLLFLTLEDGREVMVHLTLEQKDFDAEKGMARFGLVFEPGSLETLLKPPDPGKQKIIATVVKKSWY